MHESSLPSRNRCTDQSHSARDGLATRPDQGIRRADVAYPNTILILAVGTYTFWQGAFVLPCGRQRQSGGADHGFAMQLPQSEGGIINWMEYLWGYGGVLVDDQLHVV